MAIHTPTSKSGYDYSQISLPPAPRKNIFNLSHTHLTTVKTDFLYPILCMEVYPADTFNASVSSVLRLSSPSVHPFYGDIIYDYIWIIGYNRLVWEHWEPFVGAVEDPLDPEAVTDYTVPQLDTSVAGFTGFAQQSIYDYLDYPTKIKPRRASALPLRIYNKFFNDWVKSDHLQSPVTVLKDDGPDPVETYTLLKRTKPKDFFTTCTPDPQQGPPIYLPIGDSAPVYSTAEAPPFTKYAPVAWSVFGLDNETPYPVGYLRTTAGTGAKTATLFNVNDPSGHAANNVFNLGLTPGSGVYADLSNATAASVPSFMLAVQMYRQAELLNRAGTRYHEILKATFGTCPSDGRLQRIEVIGYSSHRAVSQQIIQSAGGTTPLGEIGGYMVHSTQSKGCRYTFQEHGFLMCLFNIRTPLVYQQRLPRQYSRFSKDDYFWPIYQHVGDDAVFNDELFATGNSSDGEVFGYNERYGQLKTQTSYVTSLFRSNASESLESWHLAQDFSNSENVIPALNASFIESNTPLARVLSIPSEDYFLCNFYFHIIAHRPISLYSNPMTGTHI